MHDIGIILIMILGLVFPAVAAYIAFRKGRKGWAIATIVSIFLLLGPFLGIVAILIPPRPRESEGFVCPVCQHDSLEARNVTIDRKGGERLTHWVWGGLGLLIGAFLLALGTWLVVGLLTRPLPSNVSISFVAVLFPFSFGYAILRASLIELRRWKNADQVSTKHYKCRLCKHQWLDFGESVASLPRKLSSTCVKCGMSFVGVLYDEKTSIRPDHRAMNKVGFRCNSCGSDVCAACTEKHIKGNWATGLANSPCPKCSQPFGPGYYFYQY